jgi:hypothetical protein
VKQVTTHLVHIDQESALRESGVWRRRGDS